MADYNKLAIYEINDFLWSTLQTSTLLDKNNYYSDEFGGFLTPIVPAQQIPEFNNLLPGKTYIVYDYEVKPTVEHWWITEEVITYSIVSQNYDEINKILNFMSDNFRRYDESAKDINNYVGASSTFQYHFLYIDKIVSPEYFKNEGGFMLGQADICVSYVRKLDSSGRF